MPLARRRGAGAEACCQVFDTRTDQRRISVSLHVFCLLPCGKKMECRICNQRISFVKGRHPGRIRRQRPEVRLVITKPEARAIERLRQEFWSQALNGFVQSE